MGSVFLAQDKMLGRQVAVKSIRVDPDMGQDEHLQLRERLLREARVAAALSHPNLVAIYDVGEDADRGEVYLVMEYVAGSTLEKMLEGKRALPAFAAIDILRPVADGLDYAHAQGVFHRDIKPSNLLILPSGKVKIADFGIAKSQGEDPLTKSGSVLGTLLYMAPEHFSGTGIGGGADQFSLAVTAYRMLTGQYPFAAASMAEYYNKVCQREPESVLTLRPELGDAVDSVFKQALAKNAGRRFADCRSFVEALSTAIVPAGVARDIPEPSPEAALPVPEPKRKFGRRYQVAAFVACLVLGTAVAVISRSDKQGIPSVIKPVPIQPQGLPGGAPPAPAKYPGASLEEAKAIPNRTKADKTDPPALSKSPAPSKAKSAAPPRAANQGKKPVSTAVPYRGPKEGRLVWIGELDAGERIEISPNGSSVGSMEGKLPGVAVKVRVSPESVKAVTPPGPENGWRSLTLQNGDQKQAYIIVIWSVIE
jgi:serine/threonine protein kinase